MSGLALVGLGINVLLSLVVVSLIWLWYRDARSSPAQKYSTFWARFWTRPVDGCVLWPVGFILDLLLLRPNSSPLLVVSLGLVPNAVALVYTVWLHTRCGQTVGKMVCKVRVVDHLSEGPISWWQAVLRECVPVIASLGSTGYLLYLAGSGSLDARTWQQHPAEVLKLPLLAVLGTAPLLWFVVEVVTMFSNDKRRALHDLIAGTVVVRTNVDEPTAALEPGLYPTV